MARRGCRHTPVRIGENIQGVIRCILAVCTKNGCGEILSALHTKPGTVKIVSNKRPGMVILNLTLCAEPTSRLIFLRGYYVVWAFIVGHGEVDLKGMCFFFGNTAGGVGGSGIALTVKSGLEKYMRTFMRRMMVLVTTVLLKNE